MSAQIFEFSSANVVVPDGRPIDFMAVKRYEASLHKEDWDATNVVILAEFRRGEKS